MSEWLECDNMHNRVYCENFENAHINNKLCTDLRMFVKMEDVMMSTRHSSPKRFKVELTFL